MTKAMLLLFSCVMTNILLARSDSDSLRRNMVFLEYGGTTLFYSINYDRRIHFGKHTGMIVGGGISPGFVRADVPFGVGNRRMPAVNVQAKYFVKFKKRHEIGLGFSAGAMKHVIRIPFADHIEQFGPFVFGSLQAGYGITFKRLYLGAYFTPMVLYYSELTFFPWGSVRLGFYF